MNSNKPRVLSLFSGCGGMDLGFIQEGFQIVWANDFFHDACETYKRNFGNHIFEGDIADVNFKDLPDCDVITGGFPCQDFSMIWKRGGITTDRGNLYKYFVKAITTKLPKVFIAENVKGLLTANNGMAIKQIVKDFQNIDHSGYRLYVNLFNFAEYGVPQIRERVVIIGVRNDISFQFIKPQPLNNQSNYISAGEALKGVEKISYNNELIEIRERTAKIISLIPQGGNFTNIPKDSPYYVKGMISHVYRRLHRDKPSTTIIAGGGGGTWGYHYSEPRPLTNRERARLFGYPDNFIFEGSISNVRKQIGNSVPPPGARVIAKEIMNLFKNKFRNTSATLLKTISGDALKYLRSDIEENQLNFFDLGYNSYMNMKQISSSHYKNSTVAPLSQNQNEYLTIDELILELDEQGIPLSRKQIDFRRKSGVIGGNQINPELNFFKVKGHGLKLLIIKAQAIEYIERLKKQSVHITYKDVKNVVENYDEVMLKPARNAMRANRNFTGKIEDEVKGKLVEWGLAKYVYEKIGLELVIDFNLITVTTRRRDEGDFVRCLVNNNEKSIPDEYKLSVKSTSGNLLAVPEVETTWEGNYFVLAKLHIVDKFLYDAIKAGLGLKELNFDQNLGWFEIRGFVSKKDFIDTTKSHKGVNLPAPFNMDNDFGRNNYILLPTQLNQNPDDFINLINKIKSSVLGNKNQR